MAMPSIPENIPDHDQHLIKELLNQKPPEFTDLTQTQYEAFENGALDDENHLLVAETGNGKTFVAEAITKKSLQNNENVAYLVPSVALVSEKHETISSWVPEDVEVNSGYGYNDANVIVATFESFFEAVIRGYAQRFDTVILDDFHEIYSSHRGPNIEKGISAALDQQQQVFGISATVGNPETIARWLNARLTISSEERGVPISERPVEKTGEGYAKQITRIIESNIEKGPFLVFNDTTSNAEARAKGVANKVSFDVDDDIDFRSEVDDSVTTELTDSHKELIRLMENGIAYHHAQMETGLKDLIERYTEEGVIKCVFCTTTLSYGFDSPVQSVIVADLKRWDGTRRFIGVYEYVQWIGRAGRDSSAYDQAYAFPMYDDEEAIEKFQFDTRVENKELEDVDTHLSEKNALRWLVLELVNNGWETDDEVLDFIQSTLFWSDTVEQIPQHVRDDFNVQPGREIRSEIYQTLQWLTRYGLVNKPVAQSQDGSTRYSTTELGNALVEYEHSNWFDNSVEKVIELTEWLHEQGDDLTPELLVQRLAQAYYHCDEGHYIENEGGPLSSKMQQYGLSGSEGLTSVLVNWFWCAGIPVTDIQDKTGIDDLSTLANTASNLSSAIESVRTLYEPFNMPPEPQWLEKHASQVGEGVPGPDMYLVEEVDYFGRVLYNNLNDRLDKMGAGKLNNPLDREDEGSSWDPGPDHYVIERLSKLLSERNDDLFTTGIKETHGIGTTISDNILTAVKSWDPDVTQNDSVPFAESARSRDKSADLVNYYESKQTQNEDPDTDSANQPAKNVQSTTLSDF